MTSRPAPDLAVLDLLSRTGRLGSLTAAARELGLAQPNASRAVARLERQTGRTLLVRSHQGSRLSTDGEELVAASRDLLAESARWQEWAGAWVQRAERPLAVAASQTVAEFLAPGWLAALRTRMPQLPVEMQVTNSRNVLALVATHQADLGFVEAPGEVRGLSSRTVCSDRLVVVVPPGHPWARRRRPVGLAELAATALVVREMGSGTRETLDAALAGGAGQDPVGPALVLSSTTAVLGACAAGAGPAVLSELAVATAVADRRVVLVPLAEPDLLRRDLKAVWRGGRPSPNAAALVWIAGRTPAPDGASA